MDPVAGIPSESERYRSRSKDRDRDRDHHRHRHHHHEREGGHRDHKHKHRASSRDRHSRHKSDRTSGRHHHRDRDRDSDRDRERRHRRSHHSHGRSESHRHSHRSSRRRSKSPSGKPSAHGEEKAPKSLEEGVTVVDEDEEGEWVITEETGPLFESSNEDDEERPAVAHVTDPDDNTPTSKLNKIKAEIYKAEMRGQKERAAELTEDYKKLMLDSGAAQSLAAYPASPNHQTTKIIDKRFMPSSNSSRSDPTIQDMVREEMETKGQDVLGRQMAQQIGKDGTFSTDTDYQDDMAGRLGKVTSDSDQAIRSRAIAKTRQLNQYIDKCWLCIEGKEQAPTTVISLATRTYLCMPPDPEIAKGTCVIVPTDHRLNTLECDDDEWEEIRNFMKALTRMWHDQGKGVIFYETAASRSPQKHASIFAVPVRYSVLESAPGYFSQGLLEYAEEWGDHKAIIKTGDKGRFGFQTSIAKEAPYFHVWFDIDGGMGHIIENASTWPKGDRFARQIIGGMTNVDLATVRQRGQWVNNSGSNQAKYFNNLWRGYDWTAALHN